MTVLRLIAVVLPFAVLTANAQPPEKTVSELKYELKPESGPKETIIFRVKPDRSADIFRAGSPEGRAELIGSVDKITKLPKPHHVSGLSFKALKIDDTGDDVSGGIFSFDTKDGYFHISPSGKLYQLPDPTNLAIRYETFKEIKHEGRTYLYYGRQATRGTYGKDLSLLIRAEDQKTVLFAEEYPKTPKFRFDWDDGKLKVEGLQGELNLNEFDVLPSYEHGAPKRANRGGTGIATGDVGVDKYSAYGHQNLYGSASVDTTPPGGFESRQGSFVSRQSGKLYRLPGQPGPGVTWEAASEVTYDGEFYLVYARKASDGKLGSGVFAIRQRDQKAVRLSAELPTNISQSQFMPKVDGLGYLTYSKSGASVKLSYFDSWETVQTAPARTVPNAESGPSRSGNNAAVSEELDDAVTSKGRYEHTIRHKGQEYRVASIEKTQGHKSTYSTVIIRKSDNKKVIVANRLPKEPGKVGLTLDEMSEPKVRDGIVKVPGLAREIDLEAFDAEANFVPKPFAVLKTRDGKKINYVREVDKKYRNLMLGEARDPAEAVIDEGEVLSIRKSMVKDQKGSTLIVGDPGTGKTETVRQIATRAREGKIPEIPRTWRILELEPSTLESGTIYTGMIEEEISKIRGASREVPIIWWLDEIHAIKGTGTSTGKPTDVTETLKSDLADGHMRIIGASTSEEFDKAFASNPAFVRRFTRVQHNEPSGEDLRKIVKSWMKKRGKALPEDDVIDYMIRVSGEVNAVDAQPGKVMGLVEDVYADLKIAGKHDVAPNLEDVKKSAQQLYQLHPSYFDPVQMKKLVDEIPSVLDDTVVGLGLPKSELKRLARRAIAQSQDKNKPAMRVILTGVKGTGKTELGMALARATGRPWKLIEMNLYAGGRDPNDLLKEIATQLRKNAYSVIILDEIEKAHPKIQEALLNLKANGVFTVKEGGQILKVSARNAFIISTSNAGAQAIAKAARAGIQLTDQQLKEAVARDGLSELIMDRQQVILPIGPPTRSEFREILKFHAEKEIKAKSADRGKPVKISNLDEFVERMTEQYYHPEATGRDAVRVKDIIQDAISDATLAAGDQASAAGITLRFDPKVSGMVGCLKYTLEAVPREGVPGS